MRDVSAGFKLPPSYQGRHDVNVLAWLMAASRSRLSTAWDAYGVEVGRAA
jgi:hypothetical protein